MAYAFKCDFCHEYKDGGYNSLKIVNGNGVTICAKDICNDCLEKIKTLDLSKEKEVDEK